MNILLSHIRAEYPGSGLPLPTVSNLSKILVWDFLCQNLVIRLRNVQNLVVFWHSAQKWLYLVSQAATQHTNTNHENVRSAGHPTISSRKHTSEKKSHHFERKPKGLHRGSKLSHACRGRDSALLLLAILFRTALSQTPYIIVTCNSTDLMYV